MGVHDRLGRLFEDLEQQAEGLHLAERDAELVDRSRSEYAEVTFAARLHASVGSAVTFWLPGVGALEGTLARVGQGWCLLEASPSGQEWVVPLPAVTRAAGLSERAVNAAARSLVARLPLRSALRQIADARVEVVLHHLDGTQCGGRMARVGADFVELVSGTDGEQSARHPPTQVVPLPMLAAVRCT